MATDGHEQAVSVGSGPAVVHWQVVTLSHSWPSLESSLWKVPVACVACRLVQGQLPPLTHDTPQWELISAPVLLAEVWKVSSLPPSF